MRVFIILITLTLLYVKSSSADSNLELVGGLSVTKDNPSILNHSATSSYGSGVVYGLLLEKLTLGSTIGFQTGALLDRKKLVNTIDNSKSVETQLTYVEVPLQIRLWFLKRVALGVGGYAAYGVGNAKQKTRTGAVEKDASMSFSNVSLSRFDFGLMGSLTIAFPLAPWVDFIVYGAYESGANNISTSPVESYYLRTGLGMAGLNFSL